MRAAKTRRTQFSVLYGSARKNKRVLTCSTASAISAGGGGEDTIILVHVRGESEQNCVKQNTSNQPQRELLSSTSSQLMALRVFAYRVRSGFGMHDWHTGSAAVLFDTILNMFFFMKRVPLNAIFQSSGCLVVQRIILQIKRWTMYDRHNVIGQINVFDVYG